MTDAQVQTTSTPLKLKLEITDLDVTYTRSDGEQTQAVRDFSLSVQDKPHRGEIIVLLGPSGCGKSTVLKSIAGLLTPTRGKILVEGVPVSGVGADRGMVFQQYTSFGWLTVRGNIEYGLRLAGVPAAERRDRVDHYLQLVSLQDYGDFLPKQLSGGMKQRVAIARTLINRPRLLLMDEPFGALDPRTRWEMQSLLLDISAKEDNTIILVTHDVSEAVYVADQCYVLDARPTKVLHRFDIPDFGDRSPKVKVSAAFRATEELLLNAIYARPGGEI
jgi:NitT/TauT family transport system ATP-binding protein